MKFEKVVVVQERIKNIEILLKTRKNLLRGSFRKNTNAVNIDNKFLMVY